MTIHVRIATELSLSPGQVERALELLDADNTIPFVARYRKEATGGLDEVQLQAVQDRAAYLRNLEQRKQDVLRLIDEQGKLTPELRARIEAASVLQEVEDLYLPYRQKRKTRASVAREKGLEPLAMLVIDQPIVSASLVALAQPYVDVERGVANVEDAWAGARDIVAEVMAEDASVRKALRAVYAAEGMVSSTVVDAAKDQGRKYELYYQFSSLSSKMAPHRTLALNRGEKEGVLRVGVDLPYERAKVEIAEQYPERSGSALSVQLATALADGYKRLLAPALEREARAGLTEAAEEHAITIFAANLRHLLLQPPLRGQRVMGIDPGFRTGCKVAVVDETGKYLEGATIYPHAPQGRWDEAKAAILRLSVSHGAKVIAIGNGTASRETEELVAQIIAEEHSELAYVIVNEAGASVYSASEIARKEFPDLEASQRGNISIARRLQDPLAELVKIDPKSVGVGLYQHDVDQKELAKALARVVVSCVNYAGVDLNTASSSLLQYVSGINKRVAENIVKYRDAHGRFRQREDLKKVSGLGEAAFVQAAGFLKIPGGENPLDNTFIHPESYAVCEKLIEQLPGDPATQKLAARVSALRKQLAARPGGLARLAAQLGVGVPTLGDILDNLEKPGLDPRDSLPKPILRQDVLKMEDLKEGMVLQGTVRNVVDFGAFVDIGVKQDGLVHVSQMADRFVRDPLTIVSVGDVITVRVLKVDLERGRVQLSMRDLLRRPERSP